MPPSSPKLDVKAMRLLSLKATQQVSDWPLGTVGLSAVRVPVRSSMA